MLRIYISRAINYYFFAGDPDEMFSSRVHREGWRCEGYIDFIFFWQRAHCELCHRWERRTK